MPKNLMKVDIFEPHELRDTPSAKSHYNGRTKSSPKSYSFHFDTKLLGGSFYIDWEQIPQYILDKTVIYREKLGYKKLYASSTSELKVKIGELFQAYMREYSEIKYTKKLGLELRNNQTNKGLSIGINYILFYTKTYYGEDGSVFKEVNVKAKETYDSEIEVDAYRVYDYSSELMAGIIELQKAMYCGMKEFIAKMETKEGILNHFRVFEKLVGA